MIKTIRSFIYRALQKSNKYEIPPSFENSDSVIDGPSETNSIQMFTICNIPQSICEEIREHDNLLLNSKECIIAGPLGSDIFLVKIFKKPKEPHKVQYEQKKQSLRCQASTCPRYKSFSVCSHTVAIAFKLNIFASYIKKAERRNSSHALTNAVSFGKQKDAGKKNLSRPPRGKGQQTAKMK